MLINIQSPSVAKEEDATTLLLGCHQRIRHFTGIALRLAENSDAPVDVRSETARAVLRYYTIALPLHEADENESVHPRLGKVLPDKLLAEANDEMVRQHSEIDEVIEALIPEWQKIAGNKSQSAAEQKIQENLLYTTRKLQQLWTDHLELEETQVIPAMRQYLPQSALEEILVEMRTRRST